MTTVNRPTIISPSTKTSETRIHTIHIGKNVFTVQKNGTSILSFRNRIDAIHFGKMLETHFDLTREWPMIDFEETILYKHTSKTNRFKYLYTKSWEKNKLQDFCIKNRFGMLDIFKFEDEKKLIGNAFCWDVPMNFYVNMLNDRLVDEE